MSSVPSLAVIACAVLEDEVRHFAAHLPHVREVVIMPQNLHNEPLRLQRELQAAINQLEQRSDIEAIALVYGLCSRGVEGLHHERCPLVMARAHDCVTLFLGSKERYADYLRDHPGTYWYTSGWIKCHIPPGPDRTAYQRQVYAAKYDADDVEYLMDLEKEWIANYTQATFVGLGVGETAKDVAYTRRCAECLNWDFAQVEGDATLLRDLLAGNWDESRFLVVPPRRYIRLTADERVVEAVETVPTA